MFRRKAREGVITHIDRYEIKLKGDCTYYTAKTLEEAEKIKAEIEKIEEAEVKRYNDQELREIERNKKLWFEIQHKLQTRTETTTEQRAFLRELVKKVN